MSEDHNEGPAVKIRLAAVGDLQETIEAIPIRGQLYRLLWSPGAAQGAARGDIIDLQPDGTFRVVERSGNVAIQILGEDPAAVRAAGDRMEECLQPLGGRLDGWTAHSAVFSVPASAGFPAIEEAMKRAVAESPSVYCMFANVYAADGETPLRWWE